MLAPPDPKMRRAALVGSPVVATSNQHPSRIKLPPLFQVLRDEIRRLLIGTCSAD